MKGTTILDPFLRNLKDYKNGREIQVDLYPAYGSTFQKVEFRGKNSTFPYLD